MATQHTCPGCGTSLGPDDVICVKCGTNVKTGQRLKPKVDVEDEDRITPGMRVLMVLGDFLPGLFNKKAVIGALIVGTPGIVIICLGGLALKQYGDMGAYIAAGGMVLYGQAIAFLIDGELVGLWSAFLDFTGLKWLTFFVVGSLPITLALAFADKL